MVSAPKQVVITSAVKPGKNDVTLELLMEYLLCVSVTVETTDERHRVATDVLDVNHPFLCS